MGTVRLSRDGHIAVITISSPEVRNGLTEKMAQELIAHCDEIDNDQRIGSAIIRGDNGTFCSGADTRIWKVNTDPAGEEAFHQTTTIYGAFERVGRLEVPTIAAVRGAAVGAGINLFLATDLRIVATNARLLAGFLRIGIHPGGGFFSLAGRAMGREGAAALGLFSEEITGAVAVARGLAWEAVPDDQVEERALEMADRVSRDPKLVRYTLASFKNELGPPPVSLYAAIAMERGFQMWSQRRIQIGIEKETSAI